MTPRLKMDWNSRVLVCKKCNVCVIRFQWVEGYDVVMCWKPYLDGTKLVYPLSTERFWYVICPSCWQFPAMMVPAEFVNQKKQVRVMKSREEIAKEAEDLLNKAFKPLGEFMKERDDRISALEAEVERLKVVLEIIRDGPYAAKCGFCIARVEKAEQALGLDQERSKNEN